MSSWGERHKCEQRLSQEWTLIGQKVFFSIEANSSYCVQEDIVFMDRNIQLPSGLGALEHSSVTVQKLGPGDLLLFLTTCIGSKPRDSNNSAFNLSEQLVTDKVTLNGITFDMVSTMGGEKSGSSLYRTEVAAGFTLSRSYIAAAFFTATTERLMTKAEVIGRIESFDLRPVQRETAAAKSWLQKFLGL